MLQRKLRLCAVSTVGSVVFRRNCSHISSITEIIRKWMNRIRFEDNREIQKVEEKFTIELQQTPQENEEKFIENQEYRSLMEKQRMGRIDEILGTRSYFQETKAYQERLDSDHLMEVDQLKRKHRPKSREDLSWENPQTEPLLKIKHTRKYFKRLKGIRHYPQSEQQLENLGDQSDQRTVDFLAKELLFTNLSLKPVDLTMKSIGQQETKQSVFDELHSRNFRKVFAYFSFQYSGSLLLRVPKDKYSLKLSKSLQEFESLQDSLTQVLSLDELYGVLQEYYNDERVSEWLKKVENGQLQYLISGFSTDRTESKLLFWIDLLGTKQEYVIVYKDLHQKPTSGDENAHTGKLSPVGIFNCKPFGSFSEDGSSIFLVQRSEQGVYIELIKIPTSEILNVDPKQGLSEPEIIFRCKPYEELQLFTDQNGFYSFVRVMQAGNRYDEKVFGLDERNNGSIELIQIKTNRNASSSQRLSSRTEDAEEGITNVANNQQSRMWIDWCSKGLVVMECHPVKSDFLHYGNHLEYSTEVNLIPYKEHIQIYFQSLKDSTQTTHHQLPSAQESHLKSKTAPLFEIDFGSTPVTLFKSDEAEYITELSVRSTHLVISISALSVYNKKALHFVPLSEAKPSHSLVFNCQQLRLLSYGYLYDSQEVYFALNKSSVIKEAYLYTIWKREISDIRNEQIYTEIVRVSEHVALTITCKDTYLPFLSDDIFSQWQAQDVDQEEVKHWKQQKERALKNKKKAELPVFIYMKDFENKKSQLSNQLTIKKILEKGIVLVTVHCRGTFATDLIDFHHGSGQFIENHISDLETAIEWVGNQLSRNISFYGNGSISGLMGMLLNIRYPYLFNSTVLHNGQYDLLSESFQSRHQSFLFDLQDLSPQQKKKFWKPYSPVHSKYLRSGIKTKRQVHQLNQIQSPSQSVSFQEHQEQGEDFESEQNSQQKSTIDSEQKSLNEKLHKKPAKSFELGILQNILISSSPIDKAQKAISENQVSAGRLNARKIICHLRRNRNFKYTEVFLKEFEVGQNEELFNLAFLYNNARDRMEQDLKKTKK